MKYELCQTHFFSSVTQTLTAKDGQVAHLTHKESLLLKLILEGDTDKRILMDKIWHNGIVGDSSYHKLLFELRARIQSVGLDQDLIKTLPRRGCCFVGSYKQLDDGADVNSWVDPISTSPFSAPQSTGAVQDDESPTLVVSPSANLECDSAQVESMPSYSIGQMNDEHINVTARAELPIRYFPKGVIYGCLLISSLIVPFYLGSSFSLPSINAKTYEEHGKTVVAAGEDHPYLDEKFKAEIIYIRKQLGKRAYFLCNSIKNEELSCAAHIVY